MSVWRQYGRSCVELCDRNYNSGEAAMSVHVEKNGRITTISLNRPEVRNAVDHQTAQAFG